MDKPDEVKIRTLPRPTTTERPREKAPKKSPRWIIYVGTGCALALAMMTYPQLMNRHGRKDQVRLTKSAAVHPSGAAKKSGQADLSSEDARIDDRVSRHLQDAEIKREMMMRGRELENQQSRGSLNEPNEDSIATLPEEHSYGVQLDSEDSAEKIYEDLHGEPTRYSDTLPVDKINARLANRKWMSELERRERIEFISNFVRSAYDRGYEVQFDQNLTVIGMKRINNTKVVNINQVIDRLAKQGL